MHFLAWRRKRWVNVAILVLTVVATVALASHPELRLLIPLVDSLGFDLVVLLVGSQILDFARPLAARLRLVMQPGAALLYRIAIYLLGTMGPMVDGYLSTVRRFNPW